MYYYLLVNEKREIMSILREGINFECIGKRRNGLSGNKSTWGGGGDNWKGY